MATSKIVSRVFLATDELFRMEELAVCPSSHFINDGGLQIYKNCAGNMLSSTSLTEEGVESIITPTNGLIARHLTIGLLSNNLKKVISIVPRTGQKQLLLSTSRIAKPIIFLPRLHQHYVKINNIESFLQFYKANSFPELSGKMFLAKQISQMFCYKNFETP